jgi:signal peptidase II
VLRSRFYVLALLVWIVDHLTKWVIRSNLRLSDGWTIIPGILRISYVENTGVAFGLFHQVQSVWKPYVLASMAVVAVAVILVYSLRVPPDRHLLQAALAITLGGILGNFVDRVAHGYVIDFIELHFRDIFHWPTFNVADSAITIGIVLLLVDTVRNPEQKEEAGQPG